MSNFVKQLKKLSAAQLAELRRSLSFTPGEYPAVFPLVERHLPKEAGREKRLTYYLVAGLYAWKQRAEDQTYSDENDQRDDKGPERSRRHQGLGWSMARLTNEKGEMASSTEKRFIHLLDARLDEIHQPLRQAVSLLRSKSIEIYWDQLLQDLLSWNHDKRHVQIAWAEQFYGRHTDDESEGEEA